MKNGFKKQHMYGYNVLKNKNGITLVALVITIIVLLILAGITIAQLTGHGLFNKSKKAKEESEIAEAVEDVKLKISEAQIAATSNGKGKATLEDLVNVLKDSKDQYRVVEASKETASLSSDSLDASVAKTKSQIYITNLSKYSYEVGIDSNLNILNDVKIAKAGETTTQAGDTAFNGKSTTITDFSIKESSVSTRTVVVDFDKAPSGAVVYLICMGDKLVGGTEKLPYTIQNLNKNTEYSNINIIAIDKDRKIKNSENTLTVKTLSLPDGLVDYWPLNSSLSNAMDTGAGELSVLKGEQPTYTSDGVYLNNTVLATKENYTMPDKYTMIFQVKATAINDWSWIVGKKLYMVNSGAMSGLYNCGFFVATSGYYHGDRSQVVWKEGLYKANEQATIAITHDGSKLSLYLNGNLVGSTNIANKSNDFNGKFYVGGSQLSGQDAGAGVREGYSSGYYKNVMIFNRALSLDEINSIEF